MGAIVAIIFLIVLAPTLIAFGLVPWGIAAQAWPVLALSYVPTAFVLITSLFFRAYRPLIEAPLPKSAADWLKGRLELTRKVGIVVAALDKGGNRNFFHASSGAIVLGEDVHNEHTSRAYATAAHELGHALFHTDHPRWSAVTDFARQHAGGLFQGGVGLMVGATLVGSYGVAALALGMFGLAVVLESLVVVDEAAATSIAMRELTLDLREQAQRTTARGHLRRALATYVSTVLAYAMPLVAAPWLLANIGGGLLNPGAPLVGGAATVATILSIASVAGGVAALRCIVWTRKSGLFIAFGVLVALFWTPLLTTMLCTEPGLPAWTIALAVFPAWSILTSPGAFVVRYLAGFVSRDLDVMPIPFRTPDAVPIKRVSFESLAEKQREGGFINRIMSYKFAFWAIPLALAWLAS